MIKFPLYKNISNFESFNFDYMESLNLAFQKIDKKKLNQIFFLIQNKIKKNKNIFIIGNGGAASVANHFLCDFNKGIKLSSKKKINPKIISLSNSIEIITAISNDLNYEHIFSSQLENYIQKDDCLIALSCSGNSKNILNAVKYTSKKNISTILITGFSKKKHKDILHLNLKVENYGIVEDILSIIMHTMSQYLRFELQNRNPKLIL